jgi:hypothetical protein
MPLSLCLSLLLSPPQNKLTFNEIEGLKHKAYRELKDYREVFDMESSMGGEKQAIRLSQRIAGSKQRLVATIAGQKFLESGYDGTQAWIVSYPAKQYLLKKGPNGLYTAKYTAPKAEKGSEGSFNFVYNNGYNIQFIASPPLKVVTDAVVTLAGQPARKIIAKAVIKPNERYVTVTQWFYTDKWILKQFQIEGKGKESGKFGVVGVVTDSSFAAGTTPGQFKLDPKIVKGFKRQDGK